MSTEGGVGPAVATALADARQVVGDTVVAQLVALVDGRPLLAGPRPPVHADRLVQPRGEGVQAGAAVSGTAELSADPTLPWPDCREGAGRFGRLQPRPTRFDHCRPQAGPGSAIGLTVGHRVIAGLRTHPERRWPRNCSIGWATNARCRFAGPCSSSWARRRTRSCWRPTGDRAGWRRPLGSRQAARPKPATTGGCRARGQIRSKMGR